MGGKGLEPSTNTENTTGKEQKRMPAGAPDGARQERMARNGQELPADLAELVTAWPTLPEYIRAAVSAMVKSVQGG